MKNIYVIVLVLVVGVLGFAGGSIWGRGVMMNLGLGKYLMTNGGGRGDFGGGAGMAFQGNGSNNANMPSNTNAKNNNANGEVVEVTDSEMTIKKDDGGSVLVIISDNTQVNTTLSGNISDLKTGDKVMVLGKAKTDGTVAAETIMISDSADVK